MKTTFNAVRLAAINANLKNTEITLTMKITLNDENFDKAQALEPYMDAKVGGLTIEIQPMQKDFNDKLNDQASKA